MRRTPTETDRLTGQNVRALRKYVAEETLAETVERAGLGISPQSLSRIELGEKVLTLPVATKLAAHFGTTTDRVICEPWPASEAPTVVTEQEWLGNPEPAPALFPIPAAVPDTVTSEFVIDLDNPLTPAEYREQVWIPYLEHRYHSDQEANSRHAA